MVRASDTQYCGNTNFSLIIMIGRILDVILMKILVRIDDSHVAILYHYY